LDIPDGAFYNNFLNSSCSGYYAVMSGLEMGSGASSTLDVDSIVINQKWTE
jgi:hypothetical protein